MPARRDNRDTGPEYVRLWTIQPDWVVDHMAAHGSFHASWDDVDPDYRVAYVWMREQMTKRGVSPTQEPPVWAWQAWRRFDRRQCRPDLRYSMHLPPGTPGARIELLVPRREVLLSCFDGWVELLNSVHDNQSCLTNPKSLTIFDIRRPTVDFSRPEHRSVQACLPTLLPSWVRKTQYFTAR